MSSEIVFVTTVLKSCIYSMLSDFPPIENTLSPALRVIPLSEKYADNLLSRLFMP